MKQFVLIFTNPYRLICETKESGKLRLSLMIILAMAAFNGFIAPVLYYYLNRNDFELSLSFGTMLGFFALSGAMYLIDCGILWFAAKLCGQEVHFKSVAATWGFSFIPTLICAIILIIDETYWYLFVGKPVLLFVLNTLFILLLIWKAIFYFMECREVLQLKGLKFVLSTIGIGVLFVLLILADTRLGLEVPML